MLLSSYKIPKQVTKLLFIMCCWFSQAFAGEKLQQSICLVEAESTKQVLQQSCCKSFVLEASKIEAGHLDASETKLLHW